MHRQFQNIKGMPYFTLPLITLILLTLIFVHGYVETPLIQAQIDGTSSSSTLTYGTFLGSSGIDSIFAISVDSDMNFVVAGVTTSAGFPITSNAFDNTFSGQAEGFLAKFNSQGSLVYASFLGGSEYERIRDVFLDDNDLLYILTEVQSADFPVTAGAFDETFNGLSDAAVTVLDLSTNSLVFSTFIGGTGVDFADAIHVVDDGVIISGFTQGADYPTTSGAYDTIFGGGDCGPTGPCADVYVSKLNSAGSALLFSTFYGGSSEDSLPTLGIDPSGNILLAGRTKSTDLPTTLNAFDAALDGQYDAFVAELNATGSTLLYSTYLGGAGWDEGRAVEVGADAIVIGGYASSADFPVTGGSFDTQLDGLSDVFIFSFSRDYQTVLFGTFIGGSQEEGLSSLSLNGSEILITGYTTSTDFPTTADALDPSYNDGGADTYVAQLNGDGSVLTYGTFIGGSEFDAPQEILIGPSGEIILGGNTSSTDFPTTSNGFDQTHNGATDGFLLKLRYQDLVLDKQIFLPTVISD